MVFYQSMINIKKAAIGSPLYSKKDPCLLILMNQSDATYFLIWPRRLKFNSDPSER